MESNTFALKKIYANAVLEDIKPLRDRFIGKSIFFADISYIEKYISTRHPEFKMIRVVRNFPDRIVINIIKRKPYAQVKSDSSYYLIDKEGMIISKGRSLPYKNVIIIYANPLVDRIRIGKKIKLNNFSRIKELIDYLKKDDFFSTRIISSLYSYSVNDIWFDLDGIEIKIGNSDYVKRLEILKKLIIPRFKNDWKKINYIDLRFKDPIIGYRR